jgi:hypothetical protein
VSRAGCFPQIFHLATEENLSKSYSFCNRYKPIWKEDSLWDNVSTESLLYSEEQTRVLPH